ncbi:heterodisulfide reductase [candidate division WOR-3 bacterium]|uniref:Heterodisulfide reductase n=1 Tax=candidate division WOR-3 bacterium TaxID=2052148 RepID=A0A660SK07_UNCW3|nr:MAG: heterodisulfide reductase [candidate division WOR-3 bacterium]
MSLLKEVLSRPGGEEIRRCFACSTCSGSCPVREIDGRFNPRRIIRMVLLDLKEEVLKSDFIWYCTTCNSCQERCPQGVRIYNIMNILKNIAVKEGIIHPTFKAQVDLVGRMGRLYEVEDFDNKKRTKVDLPEVKKVFPEVRRLFDLTGVRIDE